MATSGTAEPRRTRQVQPPPVYKDHSCGRRRRNDETSTTPSSQRKMAPRSVVRHRQCALAAARRQRSARRIHRLRRADEDLSLTPLGGGTMALMLLRPGLWQTRRPDPARGFGVGSGRRPVVRHSTCQCGPRGHRSQPALKRMGMLGDPRADGNKRCRPVDHAAPGGSRRRRDGGNRIVHDAMAGSTEAEGAFRLAAVRSVYPRDSSRTAPRNSTNFRQRGKTCRFTRHRRSCTYAKPASRCCRTKA